ncbi:MAG: DNA glycosylase AlkZ-like family protein, partial [Acidimicrobiales bacterium]
ALAAAGTGGPPPAGADDGRPWAALVPSLDPSTMGWRDRAWYLGDLGPQLFDGNGNAGPAIWCDGRLVGGWAHRPTGEVATRLLVDVGSEGEAAVEAQAARLQAWLDASGAHVRPRFPTPLQKELTA